VNFSGSLVLQERSYEEIEFEFHVKFCCFQVVNCGQRFTWTPSVSLETVHLNGESLILMH
jgi:hypothetical protein